MPRSKKGTLEEQEMRARLTQLRSIIRRAWSRDPVRYAIVNDPKTKRKNKSDNTRLKYEHQCAICKKWFPQKETHIDHIHAAGKLLCKEDFGPYCVFMFFSELQKVCKPCHKIKTREERSVK